MRRFNFDPTKLKRLRPPRACNSVPHHEFVDMIKSCLLSAGHAPKRVLCATQGNGDYSSLCCLVEADASLAGLPPGVGLWAGGFSSTKATRGSHLYGCVSYGDKIIPLWRGRAFRRGDGALWEPAMRKTMESLLMSTAAFPDEITRMRRRRVDGLEKQRLMAEAARKGLITYGRTSQVLAGKEYDVDETAWSMCLKFHEALDRGPAVVSHTRHDRLSQMWEFKRLVMQEPGMEDEQ